jgi:hypothetical protein
MTIARYVDQFLQCALDASRGDLQQSLTTKQILRTAQLNPDDERAVISLLIADRRVKPVVTPANGSPTYIRLTANGLAEARRLRKDSGSKAEREVYLHNTLVRWAHQKSPAGGLASLQLFAADEEWWFCGTEVTWDEVDAAVDYLEAKGLLKVSRAPGSVGIAPTAQGTDFAHSHMTLRTFMNNAQSATPAVINYIGSNVVQGDAPGSNLATGGNNTQTVNQGIDPNALAALVAQLREIAPSLGLAEQDAQDFAEEVDALEQEGADPRRGARIWRALMRMVPAELVAAGTDQAVAAVIEAGSALF